MKKIISVYVVLLFFSFLRGMNQSLKQELLDWGLVHAVERENIGDIIKCIQKGANLNSTTGAHALSTACTKENNVILSLLFTWGANPNIPHGLLHDTAFQKAILYCSESDPNIINLFLNHNADPNIKNNQGKTPFHWSVYLHNIAIVHRLLLTTNLEVVKETLQEVQQLYTDSKKPNFNLPYFKRSDYKKVLLILKKHLYTSPLRSAIIDSAELAIYIEKPELTLHVKDRYGKKLINYIRDSSAFSY